MVQCGAWFDRVRCYGTSGHSGDHGGVRPDVPSVKVTWPDAVAVYEAPATRSTELAHRWDDSDEAKDAIVAVEIDRLLQTYGDGCRFGPLLQRLWLAMGTMGRELVNGYVDGRYADWNNAVGLLATIPEKEIGWLTHTTGDQETALEVIRRLALSLTNNRVDPMRILEVLSNVRVSSASIPNTRVADVSGGSDGVEPIIGMCPGCGRGEGHPECHPLTRAAIDRCVGKVRGGSD